MSTTQHTLHEGLAGKPDPGHGLSQELEAIWPGSLRNNIKSKSMYCCAFQALSN